MLLFKLQILLVSLSVVSCCFQRQASAPEPPNQSTPGPTTFPVFDVTPSNVSYSRKSPVEAIQRLRQYYKNHCYEVLKTSEFSGKYDFSQNGFVLTVVRSYLHHHNLVIRPDDVWAAIMTQFSFYVNKHAEEFRGQFVNFEGKKTLTVALGGSLQSISYGEFVKLMTDKIHENLVDPEVREWILPSFSTTTENDLVTTGVIFMATMKKYFNYRGEILCGIPFITLEGTVEDWEDIKRRLEKLKEYKLKKWYEILEPILTEFVKAKKGNVDKGFWKRIANHQTTTIDRFCGQVEKSHLTGWITAFAAFDEEGNWHGEEISGFKSFIGRITNGNAGWLKISMDDIPSGIVEVDVEWNDHGKEYNSVMIAGHMAGEVLKDEVTLQPTLGWAIALKPKSNDALTTPDYA